MSTVKARKPARVQHISLTALQTLRQLTNAVFREWPSRGGDTDREEPKAQEAVEKAAQMFTKFFFSLRRSEDASALGVEDLEHQNSR